MRPRSRRTASFSRRSTRKITCAGIRFETSWCRGRCTTCSFLATARHARALRHVDRIGTRGRSRCRLATRGDARAQVWSWLLLASIPEASRSRFVASARDRPRQHVASFTPSDFAGGAIGETARVAFDTVRYFDAREKLLEAASRARRRVRGQQPRPLRRAAAPRRTASSVCSHEFATSDGRRRTRWPS